MSHSLFISDLHLCDSRPHIKQLFLRFLNDTASQAEALYILGDLFEYWAGDDDLGTPCHQDVVSALAQLSGKGVRVHIMHGNRDFLLSDVFRRTCGTTLLDDPILLELYGKRVLLSHGDLLCTDDIHYQQFRSQVRNPEWMETFLAQPLTQRKAQIEALRMRSEQEKSSKTESIMDVNAEAVNTLLRRHHYPEVLIHGHTHRPGTHAISVDEHLCQRWVLGDWFDSGNSLRCDHSGLVWQAIQ